MFSFDCTTATVDFMDVAAFAAFVMDCTKAIAMGIAEYFDIDLMVVPLFMAFNVLVGLAAACYMALCSLDAIAQGIHQVGLGSITTSMVVATFHKALGLACQH